MNTPQQFRAKPLIINALQYQPGPTGNCPEIAAFVGADLYEHTDEGCDPQTQWYIPTPAGEICADPGDWIIRNGQGSFSTCHPDHFAATYELREDNAHEPEPTADTD